VDVEWADGKLKRAKVLSTLGGRCSVQAEGDRPPTVASRVKGFTVAAVQGNRVTFETQAGRQYLIDLK